MKENNLTLPREPSSVYIDLQMLQSKMNKSGYNSSSSSTSATKQMNSTREHEIPIWRIDKVNEQLIYIEHAVH